MIMLNPKKQVQIRVKRICDGQEKEELYEGVPVRDLKADWSGILQAEFVSRDGMVTAISAEEIQADPSIILTNGPDEEGIRLITGNDRYGQRWCKQIESVRYVEKEERKSVPLWESGNRARRRLWKDWSEN